MKQNNEEKVLKGDVEENIKASKNKGIKRKQIEQRTKMGRENGKKTTTENQQENNGSFTINKTGKCILKPVRPPKQ